MWEQLIDQEIGRRVHRVIGAVLECGGGPEDVVVLVTRMFKDEPLGGAVQTALRSRCVSYANTYLARCCPIGWQLIGVEEPFLDCQADLIFGNDQGQVTIEELKTGRPKPTTPALADQVHKLFVAGRARWGDCFVGVRVVGLSAPSRSWMVGGANKQRVAMPAGMEIR